MMKSVILFIGVALVFACGSDQPQNKVSVSTPKVLTEAQSLLQQAYIAHGGKKYDDAHYSFVFRDRSYEFENRASGYMYKRVHLSDDTTTIDVMINGKLTRKINEVEVLLSSKKHDDYSESINSVIYFATLPQKLLDPAVNLEIVGETTIKEKQYDILKVTFDQEGGGKDYDDQFHYWINKSDHTIDYLAYNYETDEAGVRFRSAYNRRVVDGIIFQDYVNYKAELGTPLADLPQLFEQGELKELSRINTEEVKSLK